MTDDDGKMMTVDGGHGGGVAVAVENDGCMHMLYVCMHSDSDGE